MKGKTRIPATSPIMERWAGLSGGYILLISAKCPNVSLWSGIGPCGISEKLGRDKCGRPG